MSEQVGASLVLAQMLIPSQSSPLPTTGGPAADASSEIDAGIQPVDFTEENSAAFASLLTELEKLQIPAPQPNAEDLIKVRVATQAGTASEPDPATVGTPLETGKGLPVPGNPSPLGETTTSKAEPALPAPDALQPPEIILKEPSSRTSPLPADQLSPVLRESTPATTVATTGSSNAAAAALTTSAPQSATPAATPVPAPETFARSAEASAATAPASSATDARGTGNMAGDANTGQQHGEHQGDRQAQPNLSSRGPAITFSAEVGPSGAMAPSPTSTGSAATTVPAALSQPLSLLGQPSQWAEPLAERLAGLAAGQLQSRGVNTAEIRLHPPSLGQLEIRISVSNDQASLIVASANPEVREALQQALPRLDSLLSGLGIELAESEVTERQDGDFQSSADGEKLTGDQDGLDTAEPAGDRGKESGLGLLDTWA